MCRLIVVAARSRGCWPRGRRSRLVVSLSLQESTLYTPDTTLHLSLSSRMPGMQAQCHGSTIQGLLAKREVVQAHHNQQSFHQSPCTIFLMPHFALDSRSGVQARCHGSKIEGLLAKREVVQARYDAGAKPDFLPETRHVREGDWQVLICCKS